MKKILLGLLVIGFTASGQTKVEKSIPVQSGQKLILDFEFPEIRIQTWDNKDVQIKGEVTINNGENDDAFELQVNSSSKEVHVTSILKDEQNIPKRIVIKKDDAEYFFKAQSVHDPEVQKFMEENGRQYSYLSHGIIKKISLEIFVPKGMETEVVSKFGLVEVKGFQGPLKVQAKFGGIDASITERATGELIARTEFGEILTNLDVKFNSENAFDKRDRWTIISAKPGSGPRYDFESKFGKVYLRKAN